MLKKKLRVLVVDDTIVYRKAIGDVLQTLPYVEVVGVAHNGNIAMSKVRTLKPDLLTLDIEMPEMNGIEVLEQLQREAPETGVIMVSTLTAEGGAMTVKALELGAFDYLLKPATSNLTESTQYLKEMLTPMIAAFAQGHGTLASMRQRTKPPPPTVSKSGLGAQLRQRCTPAADTTVPPAATRRAKSEIVTIGISTGGPNALARMMPELPGDLGVPLVIVQHMPPVFTQSLANSLNAKCALKVKEAENGEAILPNIAYIAPGGKQMKLVASADGRNRLIRITEDPPENSCRPSADYLFRSVADYYVGRSTAVIMTGMGSDGTRGLQVLKQKGAHIIAQDKDTCVVYGMPKAPVETGLADVIAPLDRIAAEIVKSVK